MLERFSKADSPIILTPFSYSEFRKITAIIKTGKRYIYTTINREMSIEAYIPTKCRSA